MTTDRPLARWLHAHRQTAECNSALRGLFAASRTRQTNVAMPIDFNHFTPFQTFQILEAPAFCM